MAEIASALSSLARRRGRGLDCRFAVVCAATFCLGALTLLPVPLRLLWNAIETAARFFYLLAVIIG
ncbi:MAG TPA: hypothetical protein VN832_04425 [Stellaceae bacterium]|nr:hypothetical protein [Stellaceae bacterium]